VELRVRDGEQEPPDRSADSIVPLGERDERMAPEHAPPVRTKRCRDDDAVDDGPDQVELAHLGDPARGLVSRTGR
jgi:hypothetical protein